MRILGLDPSLKATGYGLVEQRDQQISVVDCGVIKTSSRQPLQDKINHIRLEVEKIIIHYHPDEVAIENPFYALNIRTAITLGQVRGAILVAIAAQKTPLFEYSPREIKKAVTGYGQADKAQVQKMIKILLQLDDSPLTHDASDALATAYCHLNTRLFSLRLKEASIKTQQDKDVPQP
ncbi:MAG TPA: crossover junction endodeoxyribonuclease RuvC [Candidatus Aminicenantes bacterium]|nr:crossover junction endodeoxyribonuclease RuvC [Candidatus Aminicenantes bacterium]